MLVRAILFLAFIFSINLYAKDDRVPCGFDFLPSEFICEMNVKAYDLDGFKKDFIIKWSHSQSSSLDSFMVFETSKVFWSYLFTKNSITRKLFTDEGKVPRGMGYHHLRERILNTQLRWEDLDMVARNDFSCSPKRTNKLDKKFSSIGKSEGDGEDDDGSEYLIIPEDEIPEFAKIVPNKSALWWSGGFYPLGINVMPDSLALRGSYGIRNLWKFKSYEEFMGKWLPTSIILNDGSELEIVSLKWIKKPSNFKLDGDVFYDNNMIFE